MLEVAEVEEAVRTLFIDMHGGDGREQARAFSVRCQDRGRGCEDDGARVFLREPEGPRGWRGLQRIQREIATPIAAGSCRSAVAGQ